jgi:hypothetical protein
MAKRFYEHPLGWSCGTDAEKAYERSRERKVRATRRAHDVRLADFLFGPPDCHSSHIERTPRGKAHLLP